MLNEEAKQRIEDQLGQASQNANFQGFIDNLTTTEELAYANSLYNWDDGFDFPFLVADHPKCDLGIALDMWWCSEAGDRLLAPDELDAAAMNWEKDWVRFTEMITDRIRKGTYVVKTTIYRIESVPEYIDRLRAAGVEEVFLTGVNPDNLAPIKLQRQPVQTDRKCPKCSKPQIFDSNGCPFCGVDLRKPSNPNEMKPCPKCGEPLRTANALQCFHCGADWH